MTGLQTTILLIVSVLFGIPILLYFIPLGLWLSALLSGVNLSLPEIIFMRLRKSPVKDIVMGLIAATKGGVVIKRVELEAFALAGGNVRNVVLGMIAAKQNGLNLSFQKATAADFKGIDLVKTVHKAVEIKEKEKIFE